jgi:hypothetical protein
MEWSEGDMSLKNPVTASGIDSGTVRLVAKRLNHYTTQATILQYYNVEIINANQSTISLNTTKFVSTKSIILCSGKTKGRKQFGIFAPLLTSLKMREKGL